MVDLVDPLHLQTLCYLEVKAIHLFCLGQRFVLFFFVDIVYLHLQVYMTYASILIFRLTGTK